jgi:NAD(P)-dependent dehydrogenase (short-subunit alcohol dehydrogenase family)
MVDYFGYSNKTCVVTGAASGMGKALAEMLVELGATVYALDRVEAPVAGIERSIVTNLGDKDSIDSAFKELPSSIDAFFGVAGVSGVHQNFVDTMMINFTANKYMTDTYLVNRMSEGGSVAFVTSNGGLRWEAPEVREELLQFAQSGDWDDSMRTIEAYEAELGGIPGSLGYILSKRVLNYWIAEQVSRFAEAGRVRVNAVLPAMTVSGMLPEFAEMKGGQAAVEADLGPAGRLAEAKEMAQVLAFLGSDLASYMSGAHLSVDFGMNAQQLAGLVPDKLSWTLRGVLSRNVSA